MAGFASATAVVLISQVLFLRRTILHLTHTESEAASDEIRTMLNNMWSYAWPFASWGFIIWAQLISDDWGLQLARNTRDVGLYNALYQVGYYPVAFLTNALILFVAPILFSTAGDASDPHRLATTRRTTAFLTRTALLTAVIGSAAAYILRHIVVAVFLGAQYRSVANLLAPLVLAGGLFAAAQFAATGNMATYETRQLIAPKVGTGLAGVALNLGGAALFGLRGVVGANVAFSVLYLGSVLFINRKPGRELHT
jgi:O-antigen/teichoic acid export membrane protein